MNNTLFLENFRREYIREIIDVNTLDGDPVKQFEKWLKEAIILELPDPNAMVLSTVNFLNEPSGRVVLLKNISEKGFVFFTSYHSPKGMELENNPKACATFFWPSLERQVRIWGSVAMISEEESSHYFNSRPRASRINTWIGQQSGVCVSKDALEEKILGLEKKFEDQEVPMPPYWGGYCLDPEKIEFWQGGAGRLHDRIRFERDHNERWIPKRLIP